MPLLALFLSWTLLLSSHLAIAKPADTDENAANSAGNAGNPNTRVYNTFSSNGGQGGGGRSGGFGMDPYLGDFDEEWAKMSGRVQSQKCVDIPSNLTLCKDIGYDRMMLPNLLQVRVWTLRRVTMVVMMMIEMAVVIMEVIMFAMIIVIRV